MKDAPDQPVGLCGILFGRASTITVTSCSASPPAVTWAIGSPSPGVAIWFILGTVLVSRIRGVR